MSNYMDDAGFFYNHKNNAKFCAPNSLYILINFRLNKYLHSNSELISLDNIARLVGFDPKLGSEINSHLSKLASGVNNQIKLQKIDCGNVIFNNYTKDELFPNLNKYHSLVICVTFYQYYQFLQNNGFNLQYYKRAEEPSKFDNIQHCITLIQNNSTILGIDPNCPLSNGYININELYTNNSDSILKLTEKDVHKLINLKYDGLDDVMIIGMEIENEFTKGIYDYEMR